MSNRQLAPKVRGWLKSTDAPPEDVHRSIGVVSERASQTRQRGRWWPLPSLRHQSGTPAKDEATPPRSSPIPATNGQTPTVIGRTQTMLSPAKAITAGALVFAIGGALLIAQPIGQQAPSVPAAEGDAVSMDAAWITGTLLHAPSCTQPDRTIDGDVVHEVGYRCESQIWETDDPRLNGRATPSWNADVYRLGPDVSVSTGIFEVETDTGRWLCSFGPTVGQGSGLFVSTNPETIACEGQDAYAGLAAVLDVDTGAGSVKGLVFAGAVPPSPETVGQ